MKKLFFGVGALLAIGLLVAGIILVKSKNSNKDTVHEEIMINGSKYTNVEYSEQYKNYYDLMSVNDNFKIFIDSDKVPYLVDVQSKQVKYYINDSAKLPSSNDKKSENELTDIAKNFIAKFYGQNAVEKDWKIIETDFGMYRAYMPLQIDNDNFVNIFNVNISSKGEIHSASCYYELLTQSEKQPISEEAARSIAQKTIEARYKEDAGKYSVTSASISCGAMYGFAWYVECVEDNPSYASGFTMVINAYTGEVMDFMSYQ